MNPHGHAITELALATATGERRAAQVRQQLATTPLESHAMQLHDHRTAVAGDLADALDRLEPNLGTRWMQAMYPEVQLSEATL
jgi:hypothetical protein